LGCGTGRDVFVAAQLVGEGGMAIGIDMTAEQLAVAEETETWHAAKFGFARPNTLFVHGEIDRLRGAGIKDGSVDVVTSNCVLNLVPHKPAVLAEIWRVLKPGGELYFSDVYADRRVPAHLQADRVLWGECLSGAMYWGDFTAAMRKAGFGQIWVTSSRQIAIGDADIERKVGPLRFYSRTVRAFKLPLEEAEEDYAQAATYSGGIPGHPHAFSLGSGATFITGVKTPVGGNTAEVLTKSRFAPAFRVTPAKDHRGAFGGGGAAAGLGGGGGLWMAPGAEGSSDDGAPAAAACCVPSSSSGSKCC
jgi:arsenite methyltransferase